MVVNELVTKLRFNTDKKDADNLKRLDTVTKDTTKSLSDLDKVLSSTSHQLKVFSANIRSNLSRLKPYADGLKQVTIALSATLAGLSALALVNAKSAKASENTANKLGLEVEELQQLEYVSQSAGLEVEELTNSLLYLRNGLNAVGVKGERAQTQLAALGISTKKTDGSLKNTSEIFSEVATSLSKMDNAAQKALISERLLGTTNNDLLDTFSQTNALLAIQSEEFAKLGYVIDKKALKSSKEFIKSWNTLKLIFDSIQKQIAFSFMPIFNDFVAVFKEWNIENREFISSSIVGTVRAIGSGLKLLFGIITTVTSPLFSLLKGTITMLGGMENALRVAAIAAGLYFRKAIIGATLSLVRFTAALLVNPIFWWGAAISAVIALLAILLEDLWGFFEGNESVTGKLIEAWQNYEGVFKTVVDGCVSYFKKGFESILYLADRVAVIFGLAKEEDENPETNYMKYKTFQKRYPDQANITYADFIKDEEKIKLGTKTPEERQQEFKERSRKRAQDLNFQHRHEKQVIDPYAKRVVSENKEILNDRLERSKLLFVDKDTGLNVIRNEDNPFNKTEVVNNYIPQQEIAARRQMDSAQARPVNQAEVKQYITENITVNVPAGTDIEQQRAITDQITGLIQEQFDQNILKGFDSINGGY